MNVQAVLEENKRLNLHITELSIKIARMQSHIDILERFHFGKKSEKLTEEDRRQAQLFNEAEDAVFKQCDEIQTEQVIVKIEIGPQERRITHRNQGRVALSKDLPREEVVYDLSAEEKICACNTEMTCIGEDVSERLVVKPAEVHVLKEIKKSYACKRCEGTTDDSPGVKTAEGTKHLIKGSIADESFLAWVAAEKYSYALPLNRQERRLKEIGVQVPRATLANQMIACGKAVQPLIDMIIGTIKSGPLINMDETRLQVLKESERRADQLSWMWVMHGGAPENPAVAFIYDASRSSLVPLELLQDYTGVLQTDDYEAYASALKKINKEQNRIKRILCWQHARKPFYQAWKSDKSVIAYEFLELIKQLFEIEDKRKELSRQGFLKRRKILAGEIFKNIEKKYNELLPQVLPSGHLGKGFNYLKTNWKMLCAYVDCYEATPSNNVAERAIRPFVIGRKNWLFSVTPRGANASANLYSLIETARLYGHTIHRYLQYVFSTLPYCNSHEDYEKLLPWNMSPVQIKEGLAQVV